MLDIGITEPEMLTDETGGNDAERCLVENQMASDFSGLSSTMFNCVNTCF